MISDIHHIATYTKVLTCQAPTRTGEYKQVTNIIHPYEPQYEQKTSYFLKVSKVLQQRMILEQRRAWLKEDNLLSDIFTVSYNQSVSFSVFPRLVVW